MAGVDSRFAFAMPVYGCGFLRDNSAWTTSEFGKMTAAQSDKWADKADPNVGWNGITKATPLKAFPPEEPNRTERDYPADRTVAEVTALEANQRLAWAAHLPSAEKGALMRMRWELELAGTEGGTRVTQRGEIDPPETSPFASMVNDDMRDSVRDGVTQNLRKLKSILEA